MYNDEIADLMDLLNVNEQTAHLISVFIYGDDDGIAAYLQSVRERQPEFLELEREIRAEVRSWFDCPIERDAVTLSQVDWSEIAHQIMMKVNPL